MKVILSIGAWLWRLACRPWTLLGLLAGCAALFGLRAISGAGADGVGLADRLAAGWLLLTLLVGAARAAEEISVTLAEAGLRAGRAQRVAEPPPPPTAPIAWLRRALLLVGLVTPSPSAGAASAVLAVRPMAQRWWRAALYVGVAMAAGGGAGGALRTQAAPTSVLLLGQPTMLERTGLLLTLDEAAVTSLPGGELRLQSAQIGVQGRGVERQVHMGPGDGALVAGRWLRVRGSLMAAGVWVEGPGGQALAAHPIDGARPMGDTARVWFTPVQQEQLVAAPQAGLLVRLVRYADANGQQGVLYAEVLDGNSGAVLTEAEVAAPVALRARGLTVTVTPEIAVRVASQPLSERLLWWVAGVLLAAGALAHVCWPRRQAWLAIAAQGDIWLLDARALPWDRRWLARLQALLAVPRDGD
jgi:hypothetical protein